MYDGVKRIGEGSAKKWLLVLDVVYGVVVIVVHSPVNFLEHNNLKMAKDQEIF